MYSNSQYMTNNLSAGRYERRSSMPVMFKAKDPISSLTHFIAMVGAIIATPILFIKAARFELETASLISLMVFMLSMIFLYGASASFHGFNLSERGNVILRKLDHAMISILIAGSYTPICIMGLQRQAALKMLIAVWAAALISLIFKLFWITCPKYMSSVIYIAMGWMCVMILPQLIKNIPLFSFVMLFVGGVFYSLGGVIYSLKFELHKGFMKNFSSHDVFHIFVMLGSLCQFISVYSIIGHTGV